MKVQSDWHQRVRAAKRPPRLCADCGNATERGSNSKRCAPCALVADAARERSRVRDPAKTRGYCKAWYRRDPHKSAVISANKTIRRKTRLKNAAPVEPVTPENWAERLALFGGFCAYCDQPATDRDHVIPLDLGGTDDILNVVPACGTCNSSKGAKNPLVWAGVPLCHEP